MADLNQFEISRILGSTMKPAEGVGFGGLRLRQTAEEFRSALSPYSKKEDPSFGYAEDRKVVEAFEAVRRGAAPDELLWNKDLAAVFARKANGEGLTAPQSYLEPVAKLTAEEPLTDD